MGRDDGKGGHDAEFELTQAVGDIGCMSVLTACGFRGKGPATWLRQLLCDDAVGAIAASDDANGLYDGRRIKQHDSIASSGHEREADDVIAKMEDEVKQRDAAASVAHAAVESQRAKVAEVRDRLKLAYEDERERKSTQARLTALQQELDRRERVAKQTSEAAAYARTQLTMHKNAAVAFALEQQRAAERKQKEEEEREAAAKAEEEKRRLETEAQAAARAKEGNVPVDFDIPTTPSGKGGSMPESFNSALVTRWQTAEERWEGFASSSSTLAVVGEEDVPWPDMTVLKLCLQNQPHLVDLKALQARWHPDRFMQKFSSRLKEKDRDSIMKRVTETAAAINALRAAEAPAPQQQPASPTQAP